MWRQNKFIFRKVTCNPKILGSSNLKAIKIGIKEILSWLDVWTSSHIINTLSQVYIWVLLHRQGLWRNFLNGWNTHNTCNGQLPLIQQINYPRFSRCNTFQWLYSHSRKVDLAQNIYGILLWVLFSGLTYKSHKKTRPITSTILFSFSQFHY